MRKRVTYTITVETDEPLADLRKPVAVMIRGGHVAVEVKAAKIRWRYLPEIVAKRRCCK